MRLIAKLITCVFCNKDKNFGECLLTYRKSALFGAFVLSILVALAIIGIGFIIKQYDFICDYEEEYFIIYRGLLYSLSPLPLFFLLWFFRHIDTQENLVKQQDNLTKQQENLQQNTLFEAQRLIVEPDNAKKSVAIAQLKILLRAVPEFRESIYIALKAGLQPNTNWKDSNELHADLSHCDLRSINLRKAQLVGANLQGTNLQFANLQKANLQNTFLRLADLRGADLRDIEYKAHILLFDTQDHPIEDHELPMYDYTTKLFDEFMYYKNFDESEYYEYEDKLLESHRFIKEENLTRKMLKDRNECSDIDPYKEYDPFT